MRSPPHDPSFRSRPRATERRHRVSMYSLTARVNAQQTPSRHPANRGVRCAGTDVGASAALRKSGRRHRPRSSPVVSMTRSAGRPHPGSGRFVGRHVVESPLSGGLIRRDPGGSAARQCRHRGARDTPRGPAHAAPAASSSQYSSTSTVCTASRLSPVDERSRRRPAAPAAAPRRQVLEVVDVEGEQIRPKHVSNRLGIEQAPRRFALPNRTRSLSSRRRRCR